MNTNPTPQKRKADLMWLFNKNTQKQLSIQMENFFHSLLIGHGVITEEELESLKQALGENFNRETESQYHRHQRIMSSAEISWH